MVISDFTESVVERAALTWLEILGYETSFGPKIAPGELDAERASYSEAVLRDRFTKALLKLNPDLPASAIDEAKRKILHTESGSLVLNNRKFHRALVDGVEVEVLDPDGHVRGERVQLADFEDPDANNWFAVNQFTIVEGRHTRRLD